MNYRSLSVDFNLYTQNDSDFKNELISLMLNDIFELQKSVSLAREQNDISIYARVCHKVNSTLTILNDPEFTNVISEMKENINNQEKSDSFFNLCYEVIRSLKAQVDSNPQ